MPNEVAVSDPLGKMIYLLAEIIRCQSESEEIYDDVTTVIRKPALLVEIQETDFAERYYFRSIDGNTTLLVIARENADRWEAYRCIENPSSETLSQILKKGNQLL